MSVNEVLIIFCQYGFRKASMEDIARAAGLSRQSIYKKYGSKEGVFEWVLAEVGALAYGQAMEALSQEEATGAERIANAFARWIGDYVPVLRSTPHGSEILDIAIEFYSKMENDHEQAFYNAIEEAMLDHGYAMTKQQAADKAFLLAMAGKGLLLRSQTSEEFHTDIARIIRAISPT